MAAGLTSSPTHESGRGGGAARRFGMRANTEAKFTRIVFVDTVRYVAVQGCDYCE